MFDDYHAQIEWIMKRIILSICILLIPCLLIAQDLNVEQTRLRTNIKNYLQQEGYVPSIDEDGDIAFKVQGGSYWINVSPNDETPMRVTLNTQFRNPSGYTLRTIKYAAAALNYHRGVKVMVFDDSFVIQSEQYVLNAEHFKYAFKEMLRRMSEVEGSFVDTCDKFAEMDGGAVPQRSSSSSGSYSSSSSSNLRIVTSRDVNVKVSERVQLKVTGQNVTKWESDNEKVARVSGSGILTGVAPGSTSVWAHYGADLKLFRVTVASSSYSSSSGSSSSGSSRTIYSKEATIRVGERVSARLSEGRVERWEINSTAAQYLTASSNGVLIAKKAGSVSVWGYVDDSPKLFKITIK